MKPLGHKAYGSIPHLPGSRLGSGDHKCSNGQAIIATEKRRDKNDLIIVQEKLDGSNVSVAKVSGRILPLIRSGYLAEKSYYEQHHYFAKWVYRNEAKFVNLLNEGERVCGEWLLLAHGTRYNLTHDPFVAFDIMTGKERMPYLNFVDRIKNSLVTANTISIGEPMSIKDALHRLNVSGHGAIDTVEGAIWRVERNNKVDFLVKYVRHDKQDGKYFAEITGLDPVWNCDISLFK